MTFEPAPREMVEPIRSTLLGRYRRPDRWEGSRLWGLRALLLVQGVHGAAWLGFAAALRLDRDVEAFAFWGGVLGAALSAAAIYALERIVTHRERTRPPF